MNVASKELCQELFEVSGWETDNWVDPDDDYLVTYEDVTVGYGGEIKGGCYAAYSLGYLLRKLPAAITPAVNNKTTTIKSYFLFVQRTPDGYVGSYNVIGNTLDFLYFKNADTPEDAAARLAIQLFKENILTKETN